MIVSMTGFGQAERTMNGYVLRVEVRSVNHRYLEPVIRLPRDMVRFEELLRRSVQDKLKRGRVEVFVSIERMDQAAHVFQVNWPVVEGYHTVLSEIAEKLGLSRTWQASELLQMEGALLQEQAFEVEDERLAKELQACISEALTELMEMREQEGINLLADVLAHLDEAEALCEKIKAIGRDAVEQNKTKLRQRIQELLDEPGMLDEQRFHMEVAIMAERMDVQEELTRLFSHINQFRSMLEQREPVGRKLDFLLQEMNREANTIGSKANHASITAWIIDLKAELEKIREQVQNIQ